MTTVTRDPDVGGSLLGLDGEPESNPTQDWGPHLRLIGPLLDQIRQDLVPIPWDEKERSELVPRCASSDARGNLLFPWSWNA